MYVYFICLTSIAELMCYMHVFLSVRFLPSPPCLEVTLSSNLCRSTVRLHPRSGRGKQHRPTVRHFRCQSILPRILNCNVRLSVRLSVRPFFFLLDDCSVLYAHVTFVQLERPRRLHVRIYWLKYAAAESGICNRRPGQFPT